VVWDESFSEEFLLQFGAVNMQVVCYVRQDCAKSSEAQATMVRDGHSVRVPTKV